MLGSLRKYGGGGNKIEISDWMGGGGQLDPPLNTSYPQFKVLFLFMEFMD